MPETTRRIKNATLRLESLEPRINLSGFSALHGTPPILFTPELAAPKSPTTNALLTSAVREVGRPSAAARPMLQSLSFGAINVSPTSGAVSIPVDSYTSISNCRSETRSDLSFSDIGYVSTSGAYVEYSINSANAGIYKLNFSLASMKGADVKVEVNGAFAGEITSPATGNWSSFAAASALVQLPAGASTLRFTAQNGSQYNLAGISLAPAATPSSITTISDSTSIPIPSYSAINNSQLEYQNNAPDIGYVSSAGAYVDYTVNITTPGNYTLTTASGSWNAASYDVYSNGTKLTSFSTPASYSWQSNASQSKSVYLSAGTQTLRFVATNNSQYNLFSFQLDRQSATPQPPASFSSDSTTAQPIIYPPVSISSRWMTSFTELDVTGTNAGDTISLFQIDNTITIIANGRTTQVTGNFGDIAVWGGIGDDKITIDASVSINARIYGGDGNDTLINLTRGNDTIISYGGGFDSLTGNSINTNYWADKTDFLNASVAESSTGHVHLIDTFFQPYTTSTVSNAIDGANLADPAASGNSWTRLSSNSFWGTGPKQEDINQGGIGDCYFLTAMQSLARVQPDKLQTLAVDLGDGTYAIQFKRNNVTQYLRVDADLPSWSDSNSLVYSHPGNSGAQWVAIMEKAYAFFRNGSNSYASLNIGWMIPVYNDFGIAANPYGLVSDQNSFYNTASTALAANRAVDIGTLGTITGGAPLVNTHAYAVVAVSKNAAGTVYVTLRNPWGSDGFTWDSNPWDGLLTMPYSTLKANSSSGSILA